MKFIIFALIPLILLIGIIPNVYSLECSDDRFLMDRPNGKDACVKNTSITLLEDRGDWELRLNLDCNTVESSNRDLPPNRFCGFNNFENVVASYRIIEKGDGDFIPFGSNPQDLSHLMIKWGEKEIPLDEFLKRSHTDAVLVVQGNDII